MKKLFVHCARWVVRMLNALFPKNPRKVFFASMPDFADNARAVYEYMSSQKKYTDFKYVWLVSKDFVAPKNPENVIFLRDISSGISLGYFRYLWHVFTSKYLFCTHCHFVEANPKRQVSVLLWHGTMLKRICAMNEREMNQPRKDQYRYFVSPSNYYVQYFCKSFLCNKAQVLVTGYPRNDFLYEETDILSSLNINREVFNKIIVYMPTFRTPIGGGYSDSSDSKQMCLDIQNRTSMQMMSDYLSERKTLLVVKWHPADVRQSIAYNLNNIVFIRNQDLASIDAQTYHLLHYADALITDYSSVFCDFLVLDRPIAFDVSDIDSYSDNRGFVFDQPLSYMPGVKLHNENEFKEFCDEIATGFDSSVNERERLKMIYNDYSDRNNCKRLLEAVGL